jgi:hypothetical protein
VITVFLLASVLLISRFRFVRSGLVAASELVSVVPFRVIAPLPSVAFVV